MIRFATSIDDVVRASGLGGQPGNWRMVDFDSGDWTIKISGRPSDDVQSGELHFYFHMGNVTDSSPINYPTGNDPLGQISKDVSPIHEKHDNFTVSADWK
jgi:hypothetical protein